MTSVIHGKFEHEETEATFSRTTLFSGAHYLVIRDKKEAAYVCSYIAKLGDKADFMSLFQKAISKDFDPDRHLGRIGLANQTTMLMSESLELGVLIRDAMMDRYGADLANHFRAFDTICSATQDRQDAVVRLLDVESLDLMIVVGGYNSSNTCNLARMCGPKLPTFHIAAPDGLMSATDIRHKPVGGAEERISTGWLPLVGPVSIGLTSGASTPDNLVETVVRRLDDLTNRP